MNDDCICEGNWRKIIKETEPFFEKIFLDITGEVCRFIGVIHSKDDYYYCMMDMNGRVQRYSCVGNLETWGFTQKKEYD